MLPRSLPEERMKMRVAFVIPLPDQVVELVQSIPRESGSPSFPRQGKTGVMHANAIRTLLHEMEYKHITRHGFRSSFRDWAGESTNYPREVCEMALAHDERDQTEGAYSRSDFLDKRRALMNDWAKFLLSNKDTLQQREVNNAFEELSNMSPRDLILRTRESLRIHMKAFWKYSI